MNCIDDLNESKERWFDMTGGGKVQFRSVPAIEFRRIQKLTVKKKVDFKKVEGTPARLEYESVDQELQTELFWDYAIVSWDEFSFKHPETGKQILCTPETCTKENKAILIMCSKKFVTFANESMKALEEDERVQAETESKNLPTGSSSES
jgi:hypothetical protein